MFLNELEKFDFKKLKKSQTKELNWGEIYAQDKDYWSLRADIQEIVPYLYLTSYMGAKNKELLLKSNISHIVVAASHLEQKFPESFVYKQIHILDLEDTQISLHFEEVFKFMDSAIDQKKNVLIHCNAGISRSATFVIGWIMTRRKIPYHEALEIVRTKRTCVCPNRGFVHQLKNLEREHSIHYEKPKPLASRRSISSPPEMMVPVSVPSCTTMAPEEKLPRPKEEVIEDVCTSVTFFSCTQESLSIIEECPPEAPPLDADIPPPPPLFEAPAPESAEASCSTPRLDPENEGQETLTPVSSEDSLLPNGSEGEQHLYNSVKTITPRDSILFRSPFSCSWEGDCDSMKESYEDEIIENNYPQNNHHQNNQNENNPSYRGSLRYSEHYFKMNDVPNKKYSKNEKNNSSSTADEEGTEIIPTARYTVTKNLKNDEDEGEESPLSSPAFSSTSEPTTATSFLSLRSSDLSETTEGEGEEDRVSLTSSISPALSFTQLEGVDEEDDEGEGRRRTVEPPLDFSLDPAKTAVAQSSSHHAVYTVC